MKETFKSHIVAPRWIGLSKFLKKEFHDSGLEYEIDSDKGLFRETVYFSLTGESKKIYQLMESILEILELYNK